MTRRTPPMMSSAVDRALGVLEALGESPAGLTHAQLCRKVGIPKSTASYLLRTLERRGYLRRDAESGRFRLGLRLLALNRAVLAGLDLRDAARPFLRELTERCRAS
jgi:DNA-binding IclR family transcriptional regulator